MWAIIVVDRVGLQTTGSEFSRKGGRGNERKTLEQSQFSAKGLRRLCQRRHHGGAWYVECRYRLDGSRRIPLRRNLSRPEGSARRRVYAPGIRVGRICGGA